MWYTWSSAGDERHAEGWRIGVAFRVSWHLCVRRGSERGARRVGPALESMYRFVLWLVPTVEKFLGRQKFLQGDRLQATALDVLERLVEATHTRDGPGPGARVAEWGVAAGRLRFLRGARSERRLISAGPFRAPGKPSRTRLAFRSGSGSR